MKNKFCKTIHFDKARNYLHYLGSRYRKPDKKLIKTDPEKQKNLKKSVTVYLDEGAIYQDALPKREWFLKVKKISLYTAIVRPIGKVITMQTKPFNQYNSSKFLSKIR